MRKARCLWLVLAAVFFCGCATTPTGTVETPRASKVRQPPLASEREGRESYELSRKEKEAILAKYLGEALGATEGSKGEPLELDNHATVPDLIAEEPARPNLPSHERAVKTAMEEAPERKVYQGGFKKKTPVGSKVLEREQATLARVAGGGSVSRAYVVPDLKPAKCQCRLSFPPADLKGGYFIALWAKARRLGAPVARRMGLRIVRVPTPPGSKAPYFWAAGSFQERWKANVAMKKIIALGHVNPGDLKVIYRPSVDKMTEVFLTKRPRCSWEAEKEVSKFVSLAKNPSKRGEAVLLYPRVVSHIVGSKLNTNALFAFYSAAMNLFYDTGHVDLAYQFARKRARLLPKPSETVLNDVVRVAKALGDPEKLRMAYIEEARALRDRDSVQALKAYRNALAIRADRELLLEVADYLEGLGNRVLAEKMRGRAYGLPGEM